MSCCFARLAVLLSILLSPLPVLAWSAQGHANIAEAAFSQLSEPQQQYFNQRAQALLNNERAKKWRKAVSQYSAFAQVAVWPDTRRDKTLGAIFKDHAKASVPNSLSAFTRANTKPWHYVNAHYWDATSGQLLLAPSSRGRCRVERVGLLDTVWSPLLAAYSEAKSPAAQGVVLAFIAHLLADAYQPLHTLAGLNSQCQSDAGGNGYCLAEKRKRYCKVNLHRLWDAGFDRFLEPINIEAVATIKTAPLDISVVINTAAQEAPFIYSTPRFQLPNKPYTQKAAVIVQRQSAAASQALAVLLQHIYEQNK